VQRKIDQIRSRPFTVRRALDLALALLVVGCIIGWVILAVDTWTRK